MTHVRIQFRLLSLLALLSLVWLPLSAQVSSSTGAIRGTVFDSSGGIVAHANVTLANTSLGIQKSLTTDTDGTFIVPLLQPAPGYQVGSRIRI